VGTQVVATFIAVYGLLMSPLGWTLAGLVWGYCFGMFLIQDGVKLLAHKIFRPKHSGFLVKEAKA
jgi:H+-transporting ATPase